MRWDHTHLTSSKVVARSHVVTHVLRATQRRACDNGVERLHSLAEQEVPRYRELGPCFPEPRVLSASGLRSRPGILSAREVLSAQKFFLSATSSIFRAADSMAVAPGGARGRYRKQGKIQSFDPF
jgi:hypothetical protein